MFLICDPYPATDPAKPDSFVINGLGPAVVNSPAEVLPDGSVQLHFLLTEAPGDYTVTVEASLAGVLSAASAPCTFTIKPLVVTPSVPQNVRTSAT
jgi:hypothetical protein